MAIYHSPYNAAEIDAALETYKNTAAEYSATSTYAVGALCLHENLLYKCTTAITTAEAWNSAHWTQVYMADLLTIAIEGVLVVNDGKLCAVYES